LSPLDDTLLLSALGDIWHPVQANADFPSNRMQARTARDIGLLIRDQRRRVQLSQQQLADRLSVSRQWIVEVEGGKPRAELELILRALSALDLTVEVSRAQPAVRSGRPASTATVDLDAVIDRARENAAPAAKAGPFTRKRRQRRATSGSSAPGSAGKKPGRRRA
jgi:HTH-type transcriptional regulator/antitoxin HipB